MNNEAFRKVTSKRLLLCQQMMREFNHFYFQLLPSSFSIQRTSVISSLFVLCYLCVSKSLFFLIVNQIMKLLSPKKHAWNNNLQVITHKHADCVCGNILSYHKFWNENFKLFWHVFRKTWLAPGGKRECHHSYNWRLLRFSSIHSQKMVIINLIQKSIDSFHLIKSYRLLSVSLQTIFTKNCQFIGWNVTLSAELISYFAPGLKFSTGTHVLFSTILSTNFNILHTNSVK